MDRNVLLSTYAAYLLSPPIPESPEKAEGGTSVKELNRQELELRKEELQMQREMRKQELEKQEKEEERRKQEEERRKQELEMRRQEREEDLDRQRQRDELGPVVPRGG